MQLRTQLTACVGAFDSLDQIPPPAHALLCVQHVLIIDDRSSTSCPVDFAHS
eukprot:COSAG01_NODE_72903_length_251_cov_2.032895_1_plen_51_part_01